MSPALRSRTAHRHTGKSGEASEPEKTDLTRWRLEVDHGRHVWHYLKTDKECEQWPQSKEDRYWLGLDIVSDKGFSVEQSALLVAS